MAVRKENVMHFRSTVTDLKYKHITYLIRPKIFRHSYYW